MSLLNRPFDRKLSTVIVKVTNICNLNCPNCFMFKKADQSWRMRQKKMARATMDAMTVALAEYANVRDVRPLHVILHGGEPLLLGHDDLAYLLDRLTSASDCFELSIQTNGTRIDDTFIELFRRFNVKVGVSLDGDSDVMAKMRPMKGGKNSYELVLRGIRLLQERLGPTFFRGLLAVIDLDADPVDIYDHFRSIGVTKMDFLLPLRNHAYPEGYDAMSMRYAGWLARLFDHYLAEDNPDVDVRIFRSIIDILIGAEMPMSTLRHSAVDIATIETDGGIELVDDLHICGNDFTKLGLCVFTSSIDAFFDHPRVLELLDAEHNLPTRCQTCKHFSICGSGGHAFRYGPDGTYNHPSIYCEETITLIEHVKRQIGEETDV